MLYALATARRLTERGLEVGRIARFIAQLNSTIPYALLGFVSHFLFPNLPHTSMRHAEEAARSVKRKLRPKRSSPTEHEGQVDGTRRGLWLISSEQGEGAQVVDGGYQLTLRWVVCCRCDTVRGPVGSVPIVKRQ